MTRGLAGYVRKAALRAAAILSAQSTAPQAADIANRHCAAYYVTMVC